MEWETVIGLEVHVELQTESKMFCGCSARFGAPPNTQVCPVCLGHPGVLPVPNAQAVRYALRVALALGCRVPAWTKFDRKNYFYPDLPKAYQISQYDQPIGNGGFLEILTPEGRRRIGITRVHMEEDAGKLLHEGGAALVDLNRAGVPLIEIVSEPDLRSPADARAYLETLRTLVAYTGVSDVRMEEGSLRADANISLRPRGSRAFGDLTEIKNLNSFRALERALVYEVERQQEILERGDRVVRETRGWDEAKGRTFSQRSKEEAHDYRYFPDPDLLPLYLSPSFVEEVSREVPELPTTRVERYLGEGLPLHDAQLLVGTPALASFYDSLRALGAPAKESSNWLMGEIMRLVNAGAPLPGEGPFTPQHLITLMGMVQSGRITMAAAKTVLEVVYPTGESPEAAVERLGLASIGDEGELIALVDQVLSAHPQVVADLLSGKEKAMGFLVGQVMRQTRGRANPTRLAELFRERMTGQ